MGVVVNECNYPPNSEDNSFFCKVFVILPSASARTDL